ncbi:MarR family winged helix-turn-helix transcriptional regulator [Aureimonas flava]|uniref:MarR family winged helix-turn-helix transcriptional regulator n=1 Tax=Aureimonas flava TaxID=2320271 RepID=UPI0010A97C53|nr:hypothetical protein [Aureimonas flava]
MTTEPQGTASHAVPQLKRRPMLVRLTTAIQQLRTVSREMPIQQLHVLLTVAAHPGIAPAKVGKLVGLEQSSVSRNVLSLSRTGSKATAGLGLIEARRSPEDHRATCLFLTDRGRLVVTTMLGTLEGRSAPQDAPAAPPAPVQPVSAPSVAPTKTRSPWAR